MNYINYRLFLFLMPQEDLPVQEFYDPQRLGWDAISIWRESNQQLQSIEEQLNKDQCRAVQDRIATLTRQFSRTEEPFPQELLKLRNVLFMTKRLAHPFYLRGTAYATTPLDDLSPKTHALLELHQYTKEPLDVINDKLKQELPVQRAWEQAKPTTPAARRAFYQETDAYIYELMAVNNIVEIANWYVQLSQKLSQLDINTVLDYGAGVGNMTLLLNKQGFDVTYADVPSKTAAFAAWRFRQRNIDISLQTIDEHYVITTHPDCIICTEVIEHVEDPDALMRLFSNSLDPGKYLAISESFAYTQFASHLSGNEHKGGNNFSTYAKEFGFEEIKPWPALPQRLFQKK